MRKGLPILACLIAVLAVVIGSRACEEPVIDAPGADLGTPDPAPDAATRDAGIDAVSTWLVAEARDGKFAAMLDGESVAAQFVIGAAGVYPPLETAGTHIALPQPARTMSGQPLDTVEVYARTDDGDHAFWGEVATTDTSVDLRDADVVTVHVVDEGGAPRSGATVRLARDTVGLVLLTAVTDNSGVATFAAMPPGGFTVLGELPGSTIVSGRVLAGGEVTLIASAGQDVFGVVTDPRGTPVSGAVVAVHGAGLDGEPLAQIPADIVTTNARGEYRASGVPGAQFAIIALADGFVPGQAGGPAVDGGTQLDVRLQSGQRVTAVVTSDGRPVDGARVEWRDRGTRTGMTGLSGTDGRVAFDGVPLSAELHASYHHFESGRVQLRTLEPAPILEVALALESSDARIWRYRLEVPDEVVLSTVRIHDAVGVACTVTTEDGRDYVARGCGEGAPSFESRTNFGVALWSAEAFVDGDTVAVPKPTPIEVRIAGAVDEPWVATTFTLVGPGPVALEPDIVELPNARRLTTSVYPGRWKLTVSNPRIGTMPFILNVGPEPLSTELELVALHRFSVSVVDRFGAALTGAYAMLFADDGSLVDISRSAGQLPLEFRVRPPFNGELLVVDPRRGEGRVRLQTSGEPPERVELDRRVLTHQTPSSRAGKPEFEQATGAQLVERDNGFVLDFATETAGTRAGLQRGDQLVTAWKQARGWRVIVKRKSTFVDVSLP